MVWYNPLSWFRRSAQNSISNANTNVLKTALRNYIKAVNSLKPNGRTNQAITNLLNQANVNATNKRVIRNRLANGIAKVVAASRRGIAQAAAAVAAGAPEGPAAAAVNNATRKINNLMKPVEVGAPIPEPVGVAGKIFGVTKGKNQNNNASRTNINYITKIAKNATYATNTNRVKAVMAYNPTLNFASLVNKTNNANVKSLLKLLANVPVEARPAVAAAAVNAVPNTGEALASMFANRTALNAVLAKTTNQKLRANINNRSKAAALEKELRNTAAAVGVNIQNKNVSDALKRIMAHESILPPKAGATATNRSRLNAALAKSQNQMLGSMTNRAQVNTLMNEVRNSARAADVNLTNKNVSDALNRIMRHLSTLKPVKLPAKEQPSGGPNNNASAAALRSFVAPGETGNVAPLEKFINVQGTNTKVKIVRTSPMNNWNFANNNNKTKYTLNKRNNNNPVIRVIQGN